MTEYTSQYLEAANETLHLSVPLYLVGMPAAVMVYLLVGTVVMGLTKRVCGDRNVKTATGDYVAGIVLWPIVLTWLVGVTIVITSVTMLDLTLVNTARRIGGENSDALSEREARKKRQMEEIAVVKREEELRQRKAAQVKPQQNKPHQQYDDGIDDSVPF